MLVQICFVVQMLNVLMDNVNVYQNITETHTLIVDQNVFSALTAMKVKLVFKKNVLTHVLVHVVKMLFVELLTISQCVAATVDTQEMPLLYAMKLEVLNLPLFHI